PPKGFQKKKINASDGASTPLLPSLAEQLSYLENPRPFKNPNYAKKTSRRSKNLKAVLTQERERERAEREKRRLEKIESGMEVDGDVEEEIPTCECVRSQRVPVLTSHRHAPYTDPATKLRYHDKSIYELIKGLSASSVKDYLAARGVNSIVK
ncbi:hypothetical protein C8R47DRAFT_1142231, partial [Mycena vitilis]